MPKQEFVLSFLTHPQDYQREATGAQVPLSFSLLDIAGYVFTYNPVAGFDGLLMDNMLVGERPMGLEGLPNKVELLAVIEKSSESFKEELLASVKEYKDSSSVADGIEAQRRSNEDGVLANEMQTGINTKRYEGGTIELLQAQSERAGHESLLSYMEIAASERFMHDSLLLEGMELGHRPGAQVEAAADYLVQAVGRDKPVESIETEILMADKNKVLGASIGKLIDAQVNKIHGAFLHRVLYGDKSRNGIDVIEKPFIEAIRDSRASKIITTLVDTIRDGRAARIIKEWVETTRHIWGARIDRTVHQGVRIPQQASDMARVIYGAIKAQDAVIERSVFYGDKSNRLSQIDHPIILGKFHTPESYIMKAISMAEKDGMAADIYQAIVGDTKAGKDSNFVEGITADGKVYLDSYIDMEASKAASVKGQVNAVANLLVSAFTKQSHDTQWIEQTLFALVSNEYRQVFIDKLREFEKIEKDTIMHALEAAEVPNPEAILEKIQDVAWNKDKPNRPAGMLHDAGQGYWDIGFDDLIDTWQPGWDYLDPPNDDYDYSKIASQVYDANGVPYNPLSPINVPEVDVDAQVSHPFPEWPTVGEKEALVDIYTYQDVLVNIATIFKKETSRLAGMTGQQALQYVLKETYAILEREGLLNLEYERVFRFVRWYAEAIVNRDAVTVLTRVYDDWSDGIMSNGGIFTYPHTKDQMTTTPLGTIESTSTTGFIEFEVEGFIDGQITLSMAISTANPASTSEIRLYIDDVLTHTHLAGDGAKRLSFDVPMGVRTYRVEYTCEVGDIAKLSGIKISGVHFVEAYTTLRDSGNVRGLKVVNDLIQNLLTYYQRHHKNKQKGAMGVKQRKIWIK